jgi:hypothetical protein
MIDPADDPPPLHQRVAVFTSFTYAYLPRALVLAHTLRAAHPEIEIWALLVDRIAWDEPMLNDRMACGLATFDHVIHADELGIARFDAWMFKHDVVEACTAVKGRMLCLLLEKGYGKVLYFDPDIAIFGRLTSILRSLETASIVLTPHQSEPNDDLGIVGDNELTSMRYGIYNLGFIGIHNDTVGLEFAAWWDRLLQRACYDDVGSGLFTDQKYCDLAPALFPRVAVERDPGCNVASWNLSRRRLSFTPEGGILVNGTELKFYHFTKINSVGDIMTEKYSGENVEVMEIWNWYKRSIMLNSSTQSDWAYLRYDNGAPIAKGARRLFRERSDLYRHFLNPFSVAGDSYHGWLQRERPDLLASNQQSAP